MTISYTLDANDFLTHQLYVASKSARIQQKRKRNRWLVPLAYLVMGLFFWYSDDSLAMAIIFIVIGALWFFIYPLWERRRYVRHYKGFIKETYQERIGTPGTAEFNDDWVYLKGDGSESKVLTTEIAEINEIGSAVYVRLRSGQSVILPKDKIGEIEPLKMRLKALAAHLQIPYVTENNWAWK